LRKPSVSHGWVRGFFLIGGFEFNISIRLLGKRHRNRSSASSHWQCIAPLPMRWCIAVANAPFSQPVPLLFPPSPKALGRAVGRSLSRALGGAGGWGVGQGSSPGCGCSPATGAIAMAAMSSRGSTRTAAFSPTTRSTFFDVHPVLIQSLSRPQNIPRRLLHHLASLPPPPRLPPCPSPPPHSVERIPIFDRLTLS